MKRRVQFVKKHALSDDESGPDHSSLTPAERIQLAWELTKTALALRGGTDVEPRLQRSVVIVRRLRG